MQNDKLIEELERLRDAATGVNYRSALYRLNKGQDWNPTHFKPLGPAPEGEG